MRTTHGEFCGCKTHSGDKSARPLDPEKPWTFPRLGSTVPLPTPYCHSMLLTKQRRRERERGQEGRIKKVREVEHGQEAKHSVQSAVRKRSTAREDALCN